MYPINVVEKETNISKYVLRMWERRYSFPKPGRDLKGERVYSDDDLEKLKLVKALMQEGYRPSKIIHQGVHELRMLVSSFGQHGHMGQHPVIVLVTHPELAEDVKDALKNHRVKSVLTISNQEDIKKLSL